MADTYHGEPCKRGHTEKYWSNDNCVECNKLWNVTRRGKRHDPLPDTEAFDYQACVELGNRILTSRWSALL